MSISEDQSFILTLNGISNKISYYTCMTVVNIGFVSNFLNILICSRKSLQKNTMGLYNIIISIFNILSFMSAYLQFFTVSVGNKDLQLESYYSCILITYFTRVVIQMSSWLNVMVSLDRTICISYPNKFVFLKNKMNISLIVIGLLAIILCLNVPNLFFRLGNQTTFIANVTNNHTICGAKSEVVLLKYLMIVVMRIVIPIILTAILNVVLISKLFKSRKNINLSR